MKNDTSHNPSTGNNVRELALSGEAGKYLTFCVADEEYGVEILKIREIMGVMDITSVPRMPVYMEGVINLRGSVIPVVDLRLKFGLDEIEHTEETCIIVVNVGREVGVIVDRVSEVLDIPGGDIEPAPSMGGSVDTSFIMGLGKVGDFVKILLDIDHVLNTDELVDISSVSSSAEGRLSDNAAPLHDAATANKSCAPVRAE